MAQAGELVEVIAELDPHPPVAGHFIGGEGAGIRHRPLQFLGTVGSGVGTDQQRHLFKEGFLVLHLLPFEARA